MKKKPCGDTPSARLIISHRYYLNIYYKHNKYIQNLKSAEAMFTWQMESEENKNVLN